MVKVNGGMLDAAGKTVSEYLAEAGYKANRVAVERNGSILPRADYDTAIIAEGDTLEVVSFVGGG